MRSATRMRHEVELNVELEHAEVVLVESAPFESNLVEVRHPLDTEVK